MSARENLSPSHSARRFFPCFVLGFLFIPGAVPSRADTLEDAARALARKVASVPQRDHRPYLHWQNHSSIADKQSEALRQSFAAEMGNEVVGDVQEPGSRALRVSVEETPSFFVLLASVPCRNGEEVRISMFPRGAQLNSATWSAPQRLLKELVWQQQEPIVDAADLGDDGNKPKRLLILNRENISLFREESDHWELLDAKAVPPVERSMRDPRGEIRFSWGRDKTSSLVLPGRVCDLEVTERIALTCHSGAQTWSDGAFIASPCDQSVWWLQGDSGDRSVPDRLLLRNPSLPKSAPPAAALELPGPLLSLSTGQAMRSNTAVAFNLSTGNYEVYRIALACDN